MAFNGGATYFIDNDLFYMNIVMPSQKYNEDTLVWFWTIDNGCVMLAYEITFELENTPFISLVSIACTYWLERNISFFAPYELWESDGSLDAGWDYWKCWYFLLALSPWIHLHPRFIYEQFMKSNFPPSSHDLVLLHLRR